MDEPTGQPLIDAGIAIASDADGIINLFQGLGEERLAQIAGVVASSSATFLKVLLEAFMDPSAHEAVDIARRYAWVMLATGITWEREGLLK